MPADPGLVLDWLSARLSLPRPAGRRASAGAAEARWEASLEVGLAGLGARSRVLVGPPEDVAPLARSDAPLVTRDSRGTWWVLDGWWLGHARVQPVADPRPPTWLRPGQLAARLGNHNTWAHVEVVLPASPLASLHDHATPTERLVTLIRSERSDLWIVVACAFAIGLLSLATPLAVQILINWLAFGGLLQPVISLTVGVLLCLGLAALLTTAQRFTVEVLERRQFVRMAADLSARLRRVDVASAGALDLPALSTRFFDVLTLQKATSGLLLDALAAALQVAVAVLVLALYHPWLLMFDALLLAGMALVLGLLGAGAESTAIAESKAKYAVTDWLQQVARHPVELRLGGANLAEVRADVLVRDWLDARSRHFRVYLRQFVGAQAFGVVASAALLVVCGSLVLDGELTLGQLVAAEFVVAMALAGFAKVTAKLDTVYDLVAGVDKLGHLLDLPLERQSGEAERGASGPTRVELDGVFHRGRPFDLVCEPGSRHVVVDDTAGESALAEVLLGLRAPESGLVRHDAAPLGELRPSARYRAALLLRPGAPLRASILEYLTLGRDDVGGAEVTAALEAVGLFDHVRSLPDGVSTRVPEARLSAPERALLLVARARVMRPRLVVVDGLTDGLRADAARAALRGLADLPSTLVVLTTSTAPLDGAVVHPPPEARRVVS